MRYTNARYNGGHAPVVISNERTPEEAFALLISWEIGPFTNVEAIEPTMLRLRVPALPGYEVCTYECDSPAHMLPLIAAVGYGAVVSGNADVVAQCDEILAGSSFRIDRSRLKQAGKFIPNAAIALAVANIEPDERLLGRGDPWDFACGVALVFADTSTEWREYAMDELLAV